MDIITVKKKIDELNRQIAIIKERISLIQKDISHKFEDTNYRIVLDAMVLRKLNRKLAKLQNNVAKLQAKIKNNREIGE